MKNEILEFIKRRFPTDCNWLNGNCYFFAKILEARFPNGKIIYDVIDGHFMFLYGNRYYDWSGEISPTGYLVEWNKFSEYDPTQKNIIIRDCVL